MSAFIYCDHSLSKNHYFNEQFQWKVISKLHQRKQHTRRTYQKENDWEEICFCLQAATLIERWTSLLHFSSCHFFACSCYFASEKPDGIATFIDQKTTNFSSKALLVRYEIHSAELLHKLYERHWHHRAS